MRRQVPQLKPRLTVRAIKPLVSGLRESGHDAGPILTAIGLDDGTLADPDGFVPTSLAMALLSRAVEYTVMSTWACTSGSTRSWVLSTSISTRWRPVRRSVPRTNVCVDTSA
jgi:hypothetical protein